MCSVERKYNARKSKSNVSSGGSISMSFGWRQREGCKAFDYNPTAALIPLAVCQRVISRQALEDG